MSSTWFDRLPRHDSASAASHGKVSVIVLGMKVLLIVAFTMDYKFHRTMLVVTCVIAGIVSLYSHVTYLPYYSARANQFHIACACVMCWACLCVAILELREIPEVCLSLLLLCPFH